MHRAGRRPPCVVVHAAIALACAACDPPRAADCTFVDDGDGPAGDFDVVAETLVDGLEVPWGLAWLDEDDLLVTERPGRLRLIEDGVLVDAPVAEFAVGGGEGGLLGVALAPDFPDSRALFLYRTTTDDPPSNVVERFVLADDRRSLAFDGVVVDDIPAARVHDGGRLAFGPDGLLYVTTGDAGDRARSRDEGSRAGKILRVAADSAVEVFARGLRNPQGLDWLRDDVLAVVDHGPTGETLQQGRDEVNLVRAGDDMGWPDATGCDAAPGVVSPILSFARALPPGGVVVYDGDAIPEWRGALVVPALAARQVQVVHLEGDAVARREVFLAGAHGRLRTAAMGADGHLYVTTSNCDGRGDCPANGDAILRLTR